MQASESQSLWQNLKKEAGSGRIALILHPKIADLAAYEHWIAASKNRYGGKRLYRVKVDPVPREGMQIDEIVIDEFPSVRAAQEFMAEYGAALKQACSDLTILAIIPEPAMTFRLVKAISWLVHLFRGITDRGTPSAHWQADNPAIWPDAEQMKVARSRNLDEPLFVYNLNQYKPVASYPLADSGDRQISGAQAYERYAKIAGFELLRRGAYPVYGGKPIGLVEGREGCILADRWDKFIFVRYPQRRNLLATIESAEFGRGQIHRDAGLARVAIFMAADA